MGILASLICGFLAGAIASWLMPGGKSGCIVNIILGLLGGVVGGWVFSLLEVSSSTGFWGTLVVSIIGACILLFIYNALFHKKH